jgi:hypothetical protein
MLEEGNSQYKLPEVSKYFQKSSRTKFWAIQLLKMLILLLLPFSISMNNYMRISEFWIESFFWNYNSNYGFYFDFNLTLLIPVYILSIPGFYYVHKLRQADPEKSPWKLGIGIAAISQLLPSLIPVPTIPYYDIYYPSYWILYSLVPFYVVIGYVIVPILNRKIQNISYSFNRSRKGTSRIERIKQIHFPMWMAILVLMIGPVIIINTVYDYSGYSSYYAVFSLLVYISGYVDLYDDRAYLDIGMTYSPSMYIITGIFCIFNVLFVMRMIRYFHGKLTQNDVLKYGVIGALWPFIFYYVIESLFASMSYSGSIIPIPLLLIVGLIAMRMGSNVHRNNSRMAKQIWEDVEPVTPVLEESFELVKVPIWYTIISHFRKNKRIIVTSKKFDTPIIVESTSDEIKVPWWYSILSYFRKKEVKPWDPDKEIDDPWSSVKSE